MKPWLLKKWGEVLTIKNGKSQKKVADPDGKYPIYGSGGLMGYAKDYLCDENTTIIGRKGSINKPIYIEEKFWNVDTAFGLCAGPNLDSKFLYYFCCTYNFLKHNKATTLPSLTKTDLLQIQIPLPPLAEQKQIAAILDAADSLRQKDQQLIEHYTALSQSLFLEMFGGLKGEKVPLSSLCKVNPPKSEIAKLDKNMYVSFVPMAKVSEYGEVELTDKRLLEEVWNGFTYFADNDVVFAKITPCMENGKGAIMRNIINGIGFGTTEFHVLRPVQNLSTPEWLYALTVQKSFRQQAELNMTGSAGQKRVPKQFFDKYMVVSPTIELQNQFAERIAIIEQQKQQAQTNLQKSEALFNSLLQRAFTGELTADKAA